MVRIGTLLAIFTTLLLSACANNTNSACAKNSICPIVIYETFPGRFATYPDHMTVKTGSGPQTLLWTFADTTKYKFSATTDNIKGDGVELVDANGSKIGMTTCFVTKRSREDFVPASEGPYYRCEIVPNKDFAATRYIIRFRTMDGSPRMVDPTVSSTGGADPDDELPFKPVSLSAANNESVELPPKTSDIAGVQVIWDSGVGAVFRRADTPMVFKDDTSSKEVDIQPCTPSPSASGATAAPQGRYYTCMFSTPAKPLSLSYTARYTDGNGASQTRSGKVTRPN